MVMSAVPVRHRAMAIAVCRELKESRVSTIAMVILSRRPGRLSGPAAAQARACCRNPHAIGAAAAPAAHGIGTASLVRRSEIHMATASSWAMAAAGVFTSLLAILLRLFLR